MIPVLLILALVIALLAIIFALQNSAAIVITFFAWQFYGSLSFLLLCTLTIGVIIGILVLAPQLIKQKLQVSGQKRQLTKLEDQSQSQTQNLAAQQQQLDILKRTQQEIWGVFSLSDSHTGLLQAHSVSQALTYTLNQVQAGRYETVSLYVLEPQDLNGLGVDTNTVQIAIANMLHTHISPKSWLHSDGQRFYCIALGLNNDAANTYGEFLRQVLEEHPVWVENREPLPIKLFVGGAIAYQGDGIDSPTLQQKAEDAYLKATRRGQNRFRMVEAVD